MSNLSLARIMYGTSEEVRSSDRFNSPGLSSISPAADQPNASGNQEPASLEELLHKAWQVLSSKH
jgi:hypothetical protein